MSNKTLIRLKRFKSGICRDCSNTTDGTVLCGTCRNRVNEFHRNHIIKLRSQVMSMLGVVCACCSEDDSYSLTIDHVNNDGNIHRKQHRSQISLYRSMIDQPGKFQLQVLCWNCNLSKMVCKGRCEHLGGAIGEPASRQANYRRIMRHIAFDKYGGRACIRCGNIYNSMLVLDHVNGGGNKQRREIGANIFSWLKAHNYPDGYQVLCQNCNMAKVRHG